MREKQGVDKKEIDSLRSDSKSLVNSLKQHQSKVFSSFSKLKETETSCQADRSNPIDTMLNSNLSVKPAARLSLKDASQEKRASVESRSRFTKKNNSIKTVSFSDYLRTCNTSGKGLVVSPRRLSKSASPHSKTNKQTKSILKKQLVQDELSDEDNKTEKRSKSISSSTSSISMSTNSLLSLNIYGEHFVQSDEFDDNLKDIFKYRESNRNLLGQTCLNDSSFIDFVAKKRQAYLNHVYNSSSNLNLNQIDSVIDDKSKHTDLSVSKTDKQVY